MKELTDKMKKKPSSDVWRKLALTTLGRISVFNKRRETEVGEVPLSLYIQSKQSPMIGNSDLLQGLSGFEKELCTRLKHLEVIGKQNRKVPIVLTDDMVHALDMLVNCRTWAKAREDNPYLFANGGTSHLKTAEAIELAAREADLQHPEWITSTKLRKYMATVSQVVSLTENELEYLANHMGHNISVHRNFYRLQDSTVELAKVSRLLLAAEAGNMGSFAGKALDDITFSDFPDYTEDTSPDIPQDGTSEDLVSRPPSLTGSTSTVTAAGPSGELDSSPPSFAGSTAMTVTVAEADDISDVLAVAHKKTEKGKKPRTCWSKKEMLAIDELVKQAVNQGKPPTKANCSQVKLDRHWKSIKFRVWAEAQKLKQKQKSIRSSLLSE